MKAAIYGALTRPGPVALPDTELHLREGHPGLRAVRQLLDVLGVDASAAVHLPQLLLQADVALQQALLARTSACKTITKNKSNPFPCIHNSSQIHLRIFNAHYNLRLSEKLEILSIKNLCFWILSGIIKRKYGLIEYAVLAYSSSENLASSRQVHLSHLQMRGHQPDFTESKQIRTMRQDGQAALEDCSSGRDVPTSELLENSVIYPQIDVTTPKSNQRKIIVKFSERVS